MKRPNTLCIREKHFAFHSQHSLSILVPIETRVYGPHSHLGHLRA